ncbi:MAG: carboxymuconolactone decarboxylase family protein [Phycisphaerales bacterium]|nr:carboxymuconolactone decarboxylase family protein [Phycisphaerales bacterium]
MSAERHYQEWPSKIATLREQAPDVAAGFGTMFQRLMRDGALSVREKELIAFAIGMSLRCEPCIYAHVEKALRSGATREQILEAAGVVVMMQGGPGYVHVPAVIEALDALGAETQGANS